MVQSFWGQKWGKRFKGESRQGQKGNWRKVVKNLFLNSTSFSEIPGLMPALLQVLRPRI